MSKEIPPLLIAGGRPMDGAVVTEMMSRTFRGMEKPQVAYIGTANGDDGEFFDRMAGMLRDAGADRVVLVPLAMEKPDLGAAKKTLSSADVIYIAGGEVEDGMVWLQKHSLVEFLQNLYREGKPFIGLSAGTIMMGSYWVHLDEPPDEKTTRLFPCLNFVPLLFDCHGEDEDWAELKAALKRKGEGARGYALCSGCVIKADSSGTIETLAKNYLVYVNQGGLITKES